MSDTALLIIDIQNDYFPGGAMELEGAEAAGAKAGAALAAFRAKKLPVLHVRHLSVRPGATFFLPATRGAEIHASVAPAAGEPVIEKNFPNSFRATDLKQRLDGAGVKHLVVAGMMTQMCVDSSVRQAALPKAVKAKAFQNGHPIDHRSEKGKSSPGSTTHLVYPQAVFHGRRLTLNGPANVA